jgi:GxxExxY protein
MKMDVEKLIKTIIDCAYNVRLQLGPGFLESVYKNALVLELKKHDIDCELEYPVNVFYDDTVVGEFRIDLIVEKTVIVELKAVNNLMSAHEVQLVNYLTATQVDNGLLINFGAPKLEIKRKYRLYRK